MLDLDQPGDAVHQHTGFAGTGAGKHALAPQRRGDGLALGIVEGVQQEGEIFIHRAAFYRGAENPGKPVRHPVRTPWRHSAAGRSTHFAAGAG
ncbi:hypothetical protein D3C76_1113920 [compost metagenome]